MSHISLATILNTVMIVALALALLSLNGRVKDQREVISMQTKVINQITDNILTVFPNGEQKEN